MTSLHVVQAGLERAVSAVLTGLSVGGNPLTVDVGIGWPPLNKLQDVARSAKSKPVAQKGAVGVYDRRIGRNTTRWNPSSFNQVNVAATLTSVVSQSVIPPAGAATITLGGTVTVGDAVSTVLEDAGEIAISPGEAQPWSVSAEVAIGGATDTPTTMAAALAALISADAVMNLLVTALAVGPVVTLTAKSGKGPIRLVSNTGNGGSQEREIGRREREFQIASWSSTEEARNAIGDPIDTMLAQAELNFGLTFPDGSQGRLLYVNDFDIEDGTLQDAYRRDFLLTIDYPVTVKDQLYAILAPSFAQQVNTPF